MTAHLDMLRAALDDEQRYARAELERQLCMPPEDQIAVGVAWPPMEIESVAPAGHGRAVVVLRARDDLHDGIGAGDPISLVPAGGGDGQPGRCVGVGRRVVEVRVEGDVPDGGPMRVQQRFDPTTWRRYAEALDVAKERPTGLTQVVLGNQAPSPPSQNLPPLHTEGLNRSQVDALRTVVASGELALVHGPPGTGKTHLISRLLRTLVDAGDRPWALADSNAAVDALTERASEAGLEVVRLGHVARMSPAIEPLSLAWRIRHGPLGKVLRSLDRELVSLWRDPDQWRERRELYAERDALYEQAKASVLASAEVFSCTLGSLARHRNTLPTAHTAIVDEATQAMEPAIWTAIPFIRRLVLVGDPEQLGPVVRQPGNPLELSLFGRLLSDNLGIPLPMLNVQHRMHARIQDLVSGVYGATYTPHPSVGEHLLRDLPGVQSTPLTDAPTLWVDTAGAGLDEAIDPTTRSLYNEGEARLVARAAGMLRAAGVQAEQMAVITPYAAQRAVLRRQPELEGVAIDTVNAFQGREREAVLCSFVRSNPDGELGFVADPRRLVVALTRARRLLWCVGDSATLAASPAYADVLDHLQGQDAWRTVWEEPWMV